MTGDKKSSEALTYFFLYFCEKSELKNWKNLNSKSSVSEYICCILKSNMTKNFVCVPIRFPIYKNCNYCLCHQWFRAVSEVDYLKIFLNYFPNLSENSSYYLGILEKYYLVSNVSLLLVGTLPIKYVFFFARNIIL